MLSNSYILKLGWLPLQLGLAGVLTGLQKSHVQTPFSPNHIRVCHWSLSHWLPTLGTFLFPCGQLIAWAQEPRQLDLPLVVGEISCKWPWTLDSSLASSPSTGLLHLDSGILMRIKWIIARYLGQHPVQGKYSAVYHSLLQETLFHFCKIGIVWPTYSMGGHVKFNKVISDLGQPGICSFSPLSIPWPKVPLTCPLRVSVAYCW